MAHNEGRAKRGPDGKFLPGHKPPRSPGRPPGAVGLKARASKVASERLEAMLGKAADVIDRALDEGDSHVATWLVDRVRPPRSSDFVEINLPTNLNTAKEAVEAAQQVVLTAGRGDISMTEARSYLSLLERLGGMQGYLELEKLRQMIIEQRKSTGKSVKTFDQTHLPPEMRLQWGQGASEMKNGEGTS